MAGLRDAATNPQPSDFLETIGDPTVDPMGPKRSNVTVHACQDVHPVRPGVVAADPATQETNERADAAQFVHPPA